MFSVLFRVYGDALNVTHANRILLPQVNLPGTQIGPKVAQGVKTAQI